MRYVLLLLILGMSATGLTQESHLNVSSGCSFKVNDAIVKIGGGVTNSGNFDVTNGTVCMNGRLAQTIPAGTFTNNSIKNLVISNNVSLQGQDTITGLLTMTGSGKTFATNDFLTLKSTASGTASLEAVPVDGGGAALNFITGKVIVERYIPARRAWRLLTFPVVNDTLSINEAWQEGAVNTTAFYPDENKDPIPGYGTHITGIAGGTDHNIGYDAGPQNNYSLVAYAGTQAGVRAKDYVGIEDLYPGQGTKNTPVNAMQGYLLFVRGNRSTDMSLGTEAPLTNTTLRACGTLKTGIQPAVSTLEGFNIVGNPFAATIDMRRIEKTGGVAEFFYIYDPALGTFGNFQTLFFDGTEYIPLPGKGSYAAPYASPGATNFINSGQSFFVQSSGPGSVVIKEDAKNLTVDSLLMNPLAPPQQLRATLYAVETSVDLLDATLTQFNINGNGDVDLKDALKIPDINGGTYLGMQRDGKNLVIERRPQITLNDTIFYNLMNASKRNYRFEFNANNLITNISSGFLEDVYLNRTTPLNLGGTTIADFAVNEDPASANPGRFRLVFKPKNIIPLLFTFRYIKAKLLNNNSITVKWETVNEGNIKFYGIEKSADGLKFVTAAETVRRNTFKEQYQWLDANAKNGNNYYRIKSTAGNGDVHYSSVVKIYISRGNGEVVLNTRVITGGIITFQLNNMPKGRYGVRLINTLGQIMYSKQIAHSEGSSTETVRMNTNLAKGLYMLEFTRPGNKKKTIEKIFVE